MSETIQCPMCQCGDYCKDNEKLMSENNEKEIKTAGTFIAVNCPNCHTVPYYFYGDDGETVSCTACRNKFIVRNKFVRTAEVEKWVEIKSEADLPKESGDYLVTVECAGTKSLLVTIQLFDYIERDWGFSDLGHFKILAWREMPKPFARAVEGEE